VPQAVTKVARSDAMAWIATLKRPKTSSAVTDSPVFAFPDELDKWLHSRPTHKFEYRGFFIPGPSLSRRHFKATDS
jgi:hypothetical protein